jgi:hypothetical protein
VNRMRSPLIALVVLALSAGAVFATKSISDAVNASSSGLAQASVASGHALLGDEGAGLAFSGKKPDATTGTDATSGTDDTTGTDSTTGTKPKDNHGATVSAAAHLSFGDLKTLCGGDLKNKGQYISRIARGLYRFDSTTGTSVDSSTGTFVCGPAAATTTGAAPISLPAGTAPTKLHGRANAAAKQAEHRH